MEAPAEGRETMSDRAVRRILSVVMLIFAALIMILARRDEDAERKLKQAQQALTQVSEQLADLRQAKADEDAGKEKVIENLFADLARLRENCRPVVGRK
jgi:hypothetical protein